MAKVKFVNKVKYKGIVYAAGEVFDVVDKDLKDVQASGAIVEEKASRRKAAETNPEDNGSGNTNDENSGEGTPQE